LTQQRLFCFGKSPFGASDKEAPRAGQEGEQGRGAGAEIAKEEGVCGADRLFEMGGVGESGEMEASRLFEGGNGDLSVPLDVARWKLPFFGAVGGK
jgi:hypothetical protein